MKTKSFLVSTFSLLIAFNLVFPKGGIKVSDIPITFGYLFFVAYSMMLFFLYRVPHLYSKSDHPSIAYYFISLPFALLILIYASFVGVDNKGYFLSIVLSFVVFPFVFFVILPSDYSRHMSIERVIVWCVRIVAAYGVFLFFYKITTGQFIEIPYLTVNEADLGFMEEKHIDRGGVFKLISTYNNGNIYGVCMLMLCPVYTFFEKRKPFKFIFLLSLLLTLSRGTWLVYLAWVLFYNFKDAKLSRIFLACFIVTAFLFVSYNLMSFIGYDSDFMFDSSGGGRLDNINTLIPKIGAFSYVPFDYVSEITYLSFAHVYGYVGLLFFLLIMLGPLLRLLFSTSIGEVGKLYLYGASIYALSCLIDGATVYIPVMFIYWLVVWLSFKKEETVNVAY